MSYGATSAAGVRVLPSCVLVCVCVGVGVGVGVGAGVGVGVRVFALVAQWPTLSMVCVAFCRRCNVDAHQGHGRVGGLGGVWVVCLFGRLCVEWVSSRKTKTPAMQMIMLWHLSTECIIIMRNCNYNDHEQKNKSFHTKKEIITL